VPLQKLFIPNKLILLILKNKLNIPKNINNIRALKNIIFNNVKNYLSINIHGIFNVTMNSDVMG
jgi:hypothetical protein